MNNKISLDLDYFENTILYKILTDQSYLNLIIDKLASIDYEYNEASNQFI